MAAINDLHANTCLRFKIRLNEKNYVSIEPAMGCFSYVGRIGGMQLVSLASVCLKGERGKGVALHELLHVAGFSHEHSRADRDDYIRVEWDEIADEHVQNFCRYDTNNMIDHYDPKSILHYSRFAFSKSGLPTITPLGQYADWQIGQRFNLSASDIFRVNKLYSCPPYKSEGKPVKDLYFPPGFYSCEKHSTNVSDSSASQEGVTQNATASIGSGLDSTKEPKFNLHKVHSLVSTHDYNGMLRLHHMVTSSQSTASASSSSSSSHNNMPLEESTEKYGITLAPAHLSSSESISSQAQITRVSEQTSTIFLNKYILTTFQATKGKNVSEPFNKELFNNTGILEVRNLTVSTEIQSQNTNVYKGPTTSILLSQSVTEGFTQDLSFNMTSDVPDYTETVNEMPVAFSEPPIPIRHNTESPVTEGPHYGYSQNVGFEETATIGTMLNSEHYGFGDGNPSSPVVTEITSVEQRSKTISTSQTAATNEEITIESILVTETPVAHVVANFHLHTSSASDHGILQVNKSTLICVNQSEGEGSNTHQTNVSTISGDIFSGQLENTFDELDKELNVEFLKPVGKRSLPDDVLPASESTKSHALPRFSDWMHSKPQKNIIIKSLFVHKKRSLSERPQKLKSTLYQILKSAGRHSSSIADSLQIRDGSVLENTMKSDISTLHLHQKDSWFPIASNGPYHKQSTLQNITTSQHRQLCGFELGFCGWSESNDDNLDWIPFRSKNNPHNGSRLRLSIPRGVHLSLRNSSKQLFPGQKAILLSPIFNSTNCISFWYGSLKHTMGTLNVYTRPTDSLGDWARVWSVVGQTPMEWRKAIIRLQASDGQMPIQVALEGIAGPSTETNIVLDNLYAGKCR